MLMQVGIDDHYHFQLWDRSTFIKYLKMNKVEFMGYKESVDGHNYYVSNIPGLITELNLNGRGSSDNASKLLLELTPKACNLDMCIKWYEGTFHPNMEMHYRNDEAYMNEFKENYNKAYNKRKLNKSEIEMLNKDIHSINKMLGIYTDNFDDIRYVLKRMRFDNLIYKE